MLNNSNTITKDYILIINGAILQKKKNQSEDWFISALQQMWWARQESNLRPPGS
jgi:hypothetical protein